MRPLSRSVADVVFDLGNEFHTNQMKFRNLELKSSSTASGYTLFKRFFCECDNPKIKKFQKKCYY
jgi:hypothetical protein